MTNGFNHITAATLLICLSHSAQADINMMEASFKTSFIDAQVEGLKISRTYDSRSTYSGLFGFGWCSNLDVQLVRLSTAVVIRECGIERPAKVSFDKNSYLFKRSDGSTQRFAVEDGSLTGIQTPGHTEVPILRQRGSERRKIFLELDELKRVRKITADGLESDFVYGPDGTLRSAKNAWSNTYKYDYDRLHNLTRIFYPDNTTETLTYDTDHDRVTSFEGRNGCTETYRHTFQKIQTSKILQTSVATLKCDFEAPQTETRFDFMFAKRSDQRWALSKLSLTREGKTQNITYKLGGLP